MKKIIPILIMLLIFNSIYALKVISSSFDTSEYGYNYTLVVEIEKMPEQHIFKLLHEDLHLTNTVAPSMTVTEIDKQPPGHYQHFKFKKLMYRTYSIFYQEHIPDSDVITFEMTHFEQNINQLPAPEKVWGTYEIVDNVLTYRYHAKLTAKVKGIPAKVAKNEMETYEDLFTNLLISIEKGEIK